MLCLYSHAQHVVKLFSELLDLLEYLELFIERASFEIF